MRNKTVTNKYLQSIECTEVAVKLRISRLRRQVNEANDFLGPDAGAASEPNSSAPASPEKRKKGRKAGPGKAKDPKNGVKDSAPTSKKLKKEETKGEESVEGVMEDS